MKRVFAGTAFAALAMSVLSAQSVSAPDGYHLRGMLRSAYETVKAHYYDPSLRGIDWDARFQIYGDKLKAAGSVGEGQAVVAAFLDGLNDSHTFLQPPPAAFQIDYGYVVGLVGDEAFITLVRPGSDAASKVKVGDRLISINGYEIDRPGFHKMKYILNTLAPRSSTNLVVRDPAGTERLVTVASDVRPKRIARALTNGNEIGEVLRENEDAVRSMRSQHKEIGDVMIWRMPAFFVEDGTIDGLISTARKCAAVILDLRGNPGGRVDTLARLVGSVFDRDVMIATRKARNGTSVLTASTRGRNAYGGKLIVLVDSASASAAEIFARVVQLEGRGTVIGDRSAGAVMEARVYPFEMTGDNLLFYAIAVTDADLLMRDGHSLEEAGVIPDERLLPTSQDLAAGRDIVMARAAQMVGLTLDPVAAGKLFPRKPSP